MTPHRMVIGYRLTAAYVILVLCVAVGFYQLGSRLNTERVNRQDTLAVILQRVCSQAKQGRRLSASDWRTQKAAWQAARDAHHASALVARSLGNFRQARIDQAAADAYERVATSIVVPPATFRC